MGWFIEQREPYLKHNIFSSPSGDGLVQDVKIIKTAITNIFVPEWGWVGSLIIPNECPDCGAFSSPLGDGLVPLDLLKRFTTKNYFRPRLGMGWFLIYCFRTNCTQIFK